MSNPALPRPPIKACLFDMDGLLLNSEDIYTIVTNTILRENGRPDLPWSIKAQLQGRPASSADKLFSDWAQLPMPMSEYYVRQLELQRIHFPTCGPLPGVVSLLKILTTSAHPSSAPTEPIHMALATSSVSAKFQLKTNHLPDIFSMFPKSQQVLGDDPRIPIGRGKPAPDIYLVALETINENLRKQGKEEIKPEECLVFEDAVPGVEAGRRAGCQVCWVPHVELLQEYKGREEQVLAGRMGEAERDGLPTDTFGTPGEIGDGWGELRTSLEGFDFERYGIVVDGKS